LRGEGAELIRRGDVHTVIAGSTEMPLLEVAHAGFGQHARPRLPATGEPITDTSRPFDRTRDGFVLGEGAGSLILEDLENAMGPRRPDLRRGRGLRLHGRTATTWSSPSRAVRGSARAMKIALERRGVPADEVDLINPHGTSTPVGDKREAERSGPPSATGWRETVKSLLVTATKSMTGHMMGAAGAFEAFRDGHDGRRADRPADHQLPRSGPGRRRLGDAPGRRAPDPLRAVEHIGLGGHNAAIIFKRWDGR